MTAGGQRGAGEEEATERGRKDEKARARVPAARGAVHKSGAYGSELEGGWPTEAQMDVPVVPPATRPSSIFLDPFSPERTPVMRSV